MMKRLYPYFLTLIFCFSLSLAKAQDSTKTAPEEKKVTEEKSAPVKSTATTAPKVKPTTHYYHKLKPAVGPLVVPATTAAAVADTSKANAKTQIDPTQLNA